MFILSEYTFKLIEKEGYVFFFPLPDGNNKQDSGWLIRFNLTILMNDFMILSSFCLYKLNI